MLFEPKKNKNKTLLVGIDVTVLPRWILFSTNSKKSSKYNNKNKNFKQINWYSEAITSWATFQYILIKITLVRCCLTIVITFTHIFIVIKSTDHFSHLTSKHHVSANRTEPTFMASKIVLRVSSPVKMSAVLAVVYAVWVSNVKLKKKKWMQMKIKSRL